MLALALTLAGGGPAARAGAGASYYLSFVANFDFPVVYTDDNGVDPNLLFAVEQPGRIMVIKDGVAQERPFLDIRDRVTYGGEQGLLSVAFAPDYADSGRFYVDYVTKGGDIRIDQFKRGRTAVRADADSRTKVIKIEHDQEPAPDRHQAGQLQFGPDGFLYASVGDGGPDTDPENDAQNKGSLLGKLLRIRPRRGGGYRVPNSNPYVGVGGKDEIFALGLRNPWRFSFDSLNGALTIGDVGMDDWEEIDYVAGGGLGANFGWNDYEGTHETTFGDGPNASPHTPPIAEFSHESPDNFCAIVGGYVVRDPDLPGLAGQYIYSDFCDPTLRLAQVPSGSPGTDLGLEADSIVSFGEGAGGQIYISGQDGLVNALEPSA